MFVIGETRARVSNGKLAMPKEYHLKKKIILGKWKDEHTLYISDSEKSLNYIAGRENELIHINVDTEDRINMLKEYENLMAEIKGCISTIEITFI